MLSMESYGQQTMRADCHPFSLCKLCIENYLFALFKPVGGVWSRLH